MRVLVKVGGAQLENEEGLSDFVASVARARDAGHELVLVHGGGNQIRALARRLGLAESYHAGLRVTDSDTAEVVLMVLGALNKRVVHALESAGVRAVGITGADGSTFHARKERRFDRDLGYVGAVVDVDPRLCESLLASGFLPVVATPAPLAADDDAPRDRFYNVNADLAAAPVAAALGARAVVFLTDVTAVLDADERPIVRLSARRSAELAASGAIRGGMLPKIEAAFAALASNPDAYVVIAPAHGPNAVLRALEGDAGTRVVHED